jgi:hypothetical protein
MARTKIAPNNVIETVTEAELVHHLDTYTESWFAEKARGVGLCRPRAIDTVSGGAITLPGPNEDALGPNMGFVWSLHVLRVAGLVTGDSLTVYRNSPNPGNFLCTLSATAPVFTFGSKSCFLRGDEKLIVTGTGLLATGDVAVNGEGFECAEIDLYKLT